MKELKKCEEIYLKKLKNNQMENFVKNQTEKLVTENL